MRTIYSYKSENFRTEAIFSSGIELVGFCRAGNTVLSADFSINADNRFMGQNCLLLQQNFSILDESSSCFNEEADPFFDF